MRIVTALLDGLSALFYLATAGWLTYAIVKPRPALTTLLALSPVKQRWLFLMLIIACLFVVLNLSIGSVLGLSSTFVLYKLQQQR
jgi:uncharacterized membrane protein